jgi:SAM-dependent methyltransferase
LALANWIKKHLPTPTSILDPACGYGELLQHIDADEKFGIDITPDFRSSCNKRGIKFQEADSLGVDWPEVDIIVSNPPFSLLDDFAARIIDKTFESDCHAFILTSVQWIDDGRRRERLEKCKPNRILRMPKRLSFTGDGKSGPTTYCWMVYDGSEPEDAIPTEWLEMPKDHEAEAVHAALSQHWAMRFADAA